MNGKIKVLLIDDHAVVRAGIRMLLSSCELIDVIADAERCEEASKLYDNNKPDVVVMDLSMPGIGGLEGIRRIITRAPDAKILVFSIHDEDVYIERAFAAGAKGYITKNSAPDILITAVLSLAEGRIFIESRLNSRRFSFTQAEDSKSLLATRVSSCPGVRSRSRLSVCGDSSAAGDGTCS